MGLQRNESGLVVGWLVKIALFVAVAGFVLVNGAAIASNVFGLSSKADEIAVEVSTTAENNQVPLSQLQSQAKTMAHEAGARLLRLWISPNNVLHVKLERRAHVYLIGQIKALRPYVVSKASGRAGIT